MAYCKNCINAVESNLPKGGLYCTIFRSLCGDTIGCSNGVDGKRKAKTNGDRIRAMTDEELAVLLQNSCCRPDLMDCPQIDDCVECWRDWLKQEADGDTRKEQDDAR